MRSDFRSSDTEFFKKQKKSWGFGRLLRVLFFILIGVAIGFWINHQPKSKDEQTTAPITAQADTETEPKSISLPVELPLS